MITPSLMYKHLKKWVVSPKTPRGWLNHVVFDGERVMASDTQKLLIIKNNPSEPHCEHVDGTPLTESEYTTFINSDYTDVGQYIIKDVVPRIKRIIPQEYQYSTKINSMWFPQMRQAFDFIKKSTKKDHLRYPDLCMLNYHDDKLFALSAGENFGVKFLLAEDLHNSTSPWYCCFNASNFMDMLDFIIDTKAMVLTFSIQLKRVADTPETSTWPEHAKWTGLWKIETDEIVAVGTSMRIPRDFNDQTHDPFIRFCLAESIRPANNAFIEL